MKNKINLTVEVIETVMETALEGGITYWADVTKYDPSVPEMTIFYEDPKTYNTRRKKITPALIQKGADVIVNTPDFAKGIPELVSALLDPYQLDAGCSDAIVQAAIFGDLVYG